MDLGHFSGFENSHFYIIGSNKNWATSDGVGWSHALNQAFVLKIGYESGLQETCFQYKEIEDSVYSIDQTLSTQDTYNPSLYNSRDASQITTIKDMKITVSLEGAVHTLEDIVFEEDANQACWVQIEDLEFQDMILPGGLTEQSHEE